MFLEYLALALLISMLTMLFFAFIYLHDLPYLAAKRRHHPHLEAIHVACWLSLFTLHAIWPIVYIWAIAVPRALHVRIVDGKDLPTGADGHGASHGHVEESALLLRVAALESRLAQIESVQASSGT